ncbi:Fic family protein [Pseudochryseolinea flava]|nr:Fic family protein [Pseudochryseolinea flava]
MSTLDAPLHSLLKDKTPGSCPGLQLLPPSSARLENNSVLRQESRAAVALAELRVWLKLHHTPNIFLENMMIREAICSTAIETRTVPFEDVLEALTSQVSRPTATIKNVLQCLLAISHGNSIFAQRRTLELTDIFQIVAQLQGISIPQTASMPYDAQSPNIKLLLNLIGYFNEPAREISPLIKMAVQHYQFESIHPFYLENGRTGRVLNLLFLQQHQLLPLPALSVSEYVLQNKIEYYHLHQQVREQNEWTSWILFFLRGIETVVKKNSQRLLAIENLYQTTTSLCKTAGKSNYTKPLVDVIFKRPYCKIEHLQEFNIAQRKAAGKYLHTLVELGILGLKKVGKENIFVHRALIDLLS